MTSFAGALVDLGAGHVAKAGGSRRWSDAKTRNYCNAEPDGITMTTEL